MKKDSKKRKEPIMQETKEPGKLRQRIFTIIGIVLCVILVPMLIINCTLLVKGWTNPEKVPDFAGMTPLIVLTGSMEDVFPGGSLIISKTVDAADIKEGDIISYFDPASKSGAVVTHKVRFVKTTEEGALVFYTYGTANTSKAFEEVTEADCEKIPAEKLVGRYTGFHINGFGSAAMFMQTTPGLIVCVIVPLVALVAYDLIRRKLYDKKHDDDKEELLRELEELRRAAAEKAAAEGTTQTAEETPAAEAPIEEAPPQEPIPEETSTDQASPQN